MKKPGRSGGKLWFYCLTALLLSAAVYVYWAYHRPLPAIKPAAGGASLTVPAAAAQLTWPAAEQAAVGIVASPVMASHGKPVPLPTASTAKLITALAVLRQKPLQPGQTGPVITLGAGDVTLYNAYKAQGGSVVPVVAGEQISEYQMLQALMLPSANNLADSLAIWAFGSLPTYATFANHYVGRLGLGQTRIGLDASGFSPTTTSTAADLVKLGETAMTNPVLAQIVGQSTASGLPVVNNIKNVNFLLGTDNIIGIKTGNTDQAGGVFISASRVSVNGRPVTIVTAVMGASNLWQAMHDSLPLIQSAQANFQPVTLVKAGQTVGSYPLPWGGSVEAKASRQATVEIWRGGSLSAAVSLKPIRATEPAGTTVGKLSMPDSGIVPRQSLAVRLNATPPAPTLRWRLLHPF